MMTYRLFDPEARTEISPYPNEADALKSAHALIASGEYDVIEVQHFRSGAQGA